MSCLACGQVYVAQGKEDAVNTTKIMEEDERRDLKVTVLKTEHLNAGSDILNIRTKGDIDLNKTLRPLSTWESFSQTRDKRIEELLNRIEQARKVTK